MKIRKCIFILSLLMVSPLSGWGAQLVYEPTNPSFGGNALNGNYLLNSAEAQNKHKDDSKSSYASSQRDPLAYFEESLVRRILNELSSQIVQDAFDGSGTGQLEDSHYQFGDYVIDVVNFGDTVSVSITDIGTGNSTIIEVPTSVDLQP